MGGGARREEGRDEWEVRRGKREGMSGRRRAVGKGKG